MNINTANDSQYRRHVASILVFLDSKFIEVE